MKIVRNSTTITAILLQGLSSAETNHFVSFQPKITTTSFTFFATISTPCQLVQQHETDMALH
ncbi:unnamed protein product [Coffea canephora]|uniref:Uncharacterized protein n=1 Tax=Coffea canephora TaxID=49390 RepID=A0A068TWJ0_COFCA|nr:unnamed protein product [Coffea canephora]